MPLEQRIALHNGQDVGARDEHVAERLYHDERDERDRLADVDEVGEVLVAAAEPALVARLPLLEREEDLLGLIAAVHVQVEEEHAVGEERLEHAEKEVGEEEELAVDQVVAAEDARRLEHDVALALLEHHRQRRSHVREHADDDHLKGREWTRYAEEDVEQDGHDLAERASRQQVHDHLAQVLEHHAAVLDGDQHGLEAVVEQHDLGGLHGHLAAAAHGDAHVGRLERRRVVDAVASHGHDVLVFLELLDDEQLLRRSGAREHDLLVLGDDAPLVLLQLIDVLAGEQERTGLHLQVDDLRAALGSRVFRLFGVLKSLRQPTKINNYNNI